MNELNVSIAFDKPPCTDESVALTELRDSVMDSGISAEPIRGPSKAGVKDGGLTLGLTIAGLALSALGNLIAAVSLWGSKRNYSITFKSGDTTFAANNLSAKEAHSIATSIKDKTIDSDIKVLVSR